MFWSIVILPRCFLANSFSSLTPSFIFAYVSSSCKVLTILTSRVYLPSTCALPLSILSKAPFVIPNWRRVKAWSLNYLTTFYRLTVKPSAGISVQWLIFFLRSPRFLCLFIVIWNDSCPEAIPISLAFMYSLKLSCSPVIALCQDSSSNFVSFRLFFSTKMECPWSSFVFNVLRTFGRYQSILKSSILTSYL